MKMGRTSRRHPRTSINVDLKAKQADKIDSSPSSRRRAAVVKEPLIPTINVLVTRKRSAISISSPIIGQKRPRSPSSSRSSFNKPSSKINKSGFNKPHLISQEWLLCQHCTYQSHRIDFFQIHMEKAHGDEEQAEAKKSVAYGKDHQPAAHNDNAITVASSSSSSSGGCDDQERPRQTTEAAPTAAVPDRPSQQSLTNSSPISEDNSDSGKKQSQKTNKSAINVKEKALMELCSRRFLGPSAFNDFRQLVLDEEVDINCVDSKGYSPLLRLCHHHSKDTLFDCVQLMLKNRKELDINLRQGVNLQQGKTGCFNALAKLCREFHGSNLYEIAQLLLQSGAQLDVTDVNKDNALIVLCANYKNERLLDVVRLLLDTDRIDVNATNSKGWTALFTLCYNYTGDNLMAIIRLLIDRRADVNKVDYCGWNCLLALTDSQKDHKDFVEILRLLVLKGVDVNAKDTRDSFTALHTICSDKYKGDQLMEILQIFLDGGADLNIASGVKQSLGWKAIHFLCWNNIQVHHFLAICRLFAQKGFQLNSRDEQGRTLLHFVCKGKMRDSQVQIVRDLLQLAAEGFGIDKTVKDDSGRKAIDYLPKQKHIDRKIKRKLRKLLI